MYEMITGHLLQMMDEEEISKTQDMLKKEKKVEKKKQNKRQVENNNEMNCRRIKAGRNSDKQ